MTTTPKARKFRIRKPGGAAPKPATPETHDDDDGFGNASFRQEAAAVQGRPAPAEPEVQPEPAPTPRRVQRRPAAEAEAPAAQPASPAPAPKGGDPLAAIRAEGLTGRQLRMARRVAQKHGIEAASDFDAVAQLRAKGIDPFARSNMLELVANAVPNLQERGAPGASAGSGATPQNLPATVKTAPAPAQAPAPAAPPAPGLIDEATRAREIMKIQRDIARRRRRKVALLSVRLFFFVMLPTMIAAFYFYVLATPMYATKSEFVIQQADSAGAGGGGLGGLFGGTGLATQQDSTAVQSYLLSRDALARLDADLGFKAHFSSSAMDALQGLDADGTNEEAYKLYKRMVQIGYDPTEGILKMEVIAADPNVSQAFSEALIRYAEERVDQLTARLRSDQMEGAAGSFESAEARMLEAQQRVVDLQEQLGVVSADSEIANTMGQISAIETELRTERLRLDQMLANARPNATRVEVSRRNIERLESELALLRTGLTDEGDNGGASLARVSAELGVAQMDLQTRQVLLQQAAQQLEVARIEANRQVRYLSTSVPPAAPDEATYPRKFENTLLAFLIFSGIYLMVSLTSSILREQVAG